MTSQENGGCSLFMLIFLALFAWFGVGDQPATNQMWRHYGGTPPPLGNIRLVALDPDVSNAQLEDAALVINARLFAYMRENAAALFGAARAANGGISVNVPLHMLQDPLLPSLMTLTGTLVVVDVSSAPDPLALRGAAITDFPTLLTSDDVVSINAQHAPTFSLVEINLSPEGAQRLAEFSEANIGGALALALDGTIIEIQTISSRIQSPLRVLWTMTQPEAELVYALISSPPLPIALMIESTGGVEPTFNVR